VLNATSSESDVQRPRTLFKPAKEKLKENVPNEYLVEAEEWERASQMAKPFAERLKRVTRKKHFVY
jgi:hypothetical protein